MMINQLPAELVASAESEQELLRVENRYWSEMFEALERLENGNPQPGDFKKVILDGYFKDKAINGVSLLATDYVKRNNFRADVMEQLIAISHLEDYFTTIKNIGGAPAEVDGPDTDESEE